jgi:hypothetical protein
MELPGTVQHVVGSKVHSLAGLESDSYLPPDPSPGCGLTGTAPSVCGRRLF